MTIAEQWRPIPGWEGQYEASNLGHVRGIERIVPCRGGQRRIKSRVLPRRLNTHGYYAVNLSRKGKNHLGVVHQLVAQAFLGLPPEGTEVCHNDGVKTNCQIDNLRYDTHKANAADTIAHGSNPFLNRTHCPRGHELRAPNLVPCKLPRRDCLACSRGRATVAAAKKFRQQTLDLRQAADRHYTAIMNGH